MREPTRSRRSDVRRRGVGLKASLVVIAVLALAIVVNRESSGDGSTVLAAPPEELVGTWVTEDPQFSARTFVIAYDHIELHLGEESGIQSHQLVSIGGVQGADSWTYDITYTTSQGDRTMTVHLHLDGVLRLKNPAEVVCRRQQTN